MTEEKKYRPLLDILIEHVNRPLPEGCDRWGFKTVDSLRRTTNGFTWPAVGGKVKAWDEGYHEPGNPRPRRADDGLCVAFTPVGASSGGLPLRGLLLVAFAQGDVWAEGVRGEKARIAGYVHVVGEALIGDLDLSGADLRNADLNGADLRGADLSDAYLYRADLRSAYLRGAYLRSADLRGAHLNDADLNGAYLRGATLPPWVHAARVSNH